MSSNDFSMLFMDPKLKKQSFEALCKEYEDKKNSLAQEISKKRKELSEIISQIQDQKSFIEQERMNFESIMVDAQQVETITIAEAKRLLEARVEEAERDAAIVRKQLLNKINKEADDIRASANEEKIKVEQDAETLLQQKMAFQEESSKANAELDAERKKLSEKQVALDGRQAEIDRRQMEIDRRQVEIDRDSKKIDSALAGLDNELKNRRNSLEQELIDLRNEAESKNNLFVAEQHSNLKKELEKLRTDFDIEKKEEREKLSKYKQGLDSEYSIRLSELEKEYQDKESVLKNEREALEIEKGKLSAQQSALQRDKADHEEALAQYKEWKERERRRLRESEENILLRVEEQVEEARDTYENEKQDLQRKLRELRSQLWTQEQLMSNFEELEHRLGGRTAEAVIHELNLKTDEIRRLKEELSTKPTEETRERINQLESKLRDSEMQISKLDAELQAKSQPAAVTEQLKRENLDLKRKLELEETQLESYKAWDAIADQRYAKLLADYESLRGTPADEDNRRAQVEVPFISKAILDAEKTPFESDSYPSEMDWLNGILNSCEEYGLHFNRRLLYAFHTALKTAEWAPITVLAGVSGTGKSELPRLYSHFGGLYFCPVAVQPNWDSQESMLGYFNSIDNHFDSTPLLNFLAQSQKNTANDYPGLVKAVNVVLLDEMNLAHPELYFADFLSKLELRRGQSRLELPSVQVKLGAGIPAYRLPLGRNVLWVGTMNQDETTKSLSDKVLDRAIIINFPRPTELKRRRKLAVLDAKTRGQPLPADCWRRWIQWNSLFEENEISPYKKYVETLNSCLGTVGRAVGHRVWQSIEYYMSNHPRVLASTDKTSREKAMHLAFEDQLVQKIMPKIRGVETRGRAKSECLDKIRNLLVSGVNGQPFKLTEDFDLSCELGYGQFIWQSANYLLEDEDIREE